MNPQFFHKNQGITETVYFVRSDEASYEYVRHGFGTLKGHTFGLGKSQEHQMLYAQMRSFRYAAFPNAAFSKMRHHAVRMIQHF